MKRDLKFLIHYRDPLHFDKGVQVFVLSVNVHNKEHALRLLKCSLEDILGIKENQNLFLEVKSFIVKIRRMNSYGKNA